MSKQSTVLIKTCSQRAHDASATGALLGAETDIVDLSDGLAHTLLKRNLSLARQ